MYALEELSIEVTNECNLSCIHCSSGSTPKRLKNELSGEELIRLIHEARELGATVLSLSGGNPLLLSVASVPSLAIFALQQGYEKVLVYTTGHNQHGNTIDLWPFVHSMCNVGLDYDGTVVWIVSMHSHQPQVNDMIMNKKGALDDIVASVKWLVANDQAVEVHMVPMKPNFRHIPQVRDLCADIGVRRLSLLRFVPQTRGYVNRDILGMTVEEFVEMQRMFMDLMNDNDHPVDVRLGCPIDFRHTVDDNIVDKIKPCHAGSDLILVRPDGAVHPCAAWKSLPTDSDVRKHSLKDIWDYGETFVAIRAYLDSGYKSVPGCSGCIAVDSCKTGCPAQRLHAYGKSLNDLYSMWSDPLCPVGLKDG